MNVARLPTRNLIFVAEIDGVRHESYDFHELWVLANKARRAGKDATVGHTWDSK